MFLDRFDAGAQLASRLQRHARTDRTLVLALPRGGVPVAFEIARTLQLPLDVLMVRKIGAPGQPELAIGAIAQIAGQRRVLVMNEEAYDQFSVQEDLITANTQRAELELQRREQLYRGELSPQEFENRTVIVVDDGAATGATMRAAVQALKSAGVKLVIAALPVCSREAQRVLSAEADEVVCIAVPHSFFAVGQWYDDFRQTSDDEVQELLTTSANSRR